MIKHILVFCALVPLLGGCSPSLQSNNRDSVLVEQLFFGRNVLGALAVSDSAWTVFLSEVVTPRFPNGFTVWQAEGQWRGANNQVEHEPSFVLELVHPLNTTTEAEIGAIIAEYKQRFHQESVLRVVVRGSAVF